MACSSTPDKGDGAGGAGGAGMDGAQTGTAGRGGWSGSPLDDPKYLNNMVIYFDFDSSDIRSDNIPVLRAHANQMVKNASKRVTIEGHCDERGSREYNMALGERRANMVKRFMVAEGVSDSQITTISYGEERPAEEGSGESSWSMNRRAVFVY